VPEITRLQRMKTGALIAYACSAGAILGRADHHQRHVLNGYAHDVGLAFQITDDLLDVTASAEDLGKTPGKDAESRKATYPALYGIEETREAAMKAHRAAGEALDRIDRETTVLREIAGFILNRTA
jgi:farnesyl diphosphate synthase